MQHYQRIRDLREDHDLTQEALCKKLYMHKTTYTNYEQGKHSVPLDFAVLLANFYDVSLDYLAGRTNLPKNPHGITIADDALLVLQKIHRPHRTQQGQAGAVSRHPLRTTGSAKRNTIVRVK